jgi:ribonuclease R
MNRAGFGFVRPAGQGPPDIYVAARHIGDAIHGDLVEVIARAGRDESYPEGRIVRVLERSAERLLGTVERVGKGLALVPAHPLLPQRMSLFEPPADVEAGKKVLFRLRGEDLRRAVPRAVILEVLGDAEDPLIDARVVQREFDLPVDFPGGVLEEAASLADPASSDAALAALLGSEPGRRDLRGLPTITIDPETARDFDDAVGAEEAGTGIRVWVHVADVSHFVRGGTRLDAHAFERGTSVYFAETVVPMLPARLSEDLCSLRPGESRLAMTVRADIARDGRVVETEIFPSVIRSDQRLTYEEAQAILDGTRRAPEWLGGMLALLASAARALRSRRFARGALDLDVPEPEIEVDRLGRPTSLRRRASLFSHHLIEECMLAANEAVGRWAAAQRRPFVYRVHEPPDPKRVEEFHAFLLALGLPPPRGGDGIKGRELRDALERPMAEGVRRLVHSYLLRSLKKARYQTADVGHYGLGASLYCHFTSPIRRYPDLVDHRIVKAILSRRRGAVALPASDLDLLSDRCSDREVRAEQAEREYDRIKAVRLARERVGDVFSGIVTGVIPAGAFVELDDMPLEGFVARQTLQGHHRFDPAHFRLLSTRGGGGIAVGDRVDVQIARADPEAREVDFELLGTERRRGPRLPPAGGGPGEKRRAKPRRKERGTRRARPRRRARGSSHSGPRAA